MKKLVYILSLAAGLVMTGCAKWDTPVSMPRDTWGPEPQLTVNVNVDSVTGALTSDEMRITVITKNAKNFAITLTDDVQSEMDYTALLQGSYSAAYGEVKVEGDTISLNPIPVEAGMSYHVYVVAANEAGVQTTFYQAYGAVDITAPYIVGDEVSVSNKGRTGKITFSESIICKDPNTVKYEVFDENLVSSGQKTGLSVAASGSTLTVTLPEGALPAEAVSYVLISFDEGAIEDVAGNKMGALNNVIDEEGLPTGPFWVADLTGGDLPEGDMFFTSDERFAWIAKFSNDGENFGNFGSYFDVEMVDDQIDLSTIFENLTGTGIKWTTSSILEVFEGSDPKRMPVYTFITDVPEAGGEIEFIYFLDADNEDMGLAPCAGSVTMEGTEYDVYLGDLNTETNELYTGWSFYVNPEGVAAFNGKLPVLFVMYEGSPATIGQFSEFVLVPGKMTNENATRATMYKEPVMLNATVVSGADKRINFQ